MTRSAPAAVAPGLWKVDPAGSLVQFHARDLLRKPVTGTMPVLSGRVQVDQHGTPVEVTAVLDLAGVVTGHVKRDRHLAGRPFFDVETSPLLHFTGGPARSRDEGAWSIPGSLVLKGTRCPVDLEVELLTQDGGSVRVRATADLDRRDAGIRVPRLLVGPRVSITVDAELVAPR